MGKLNNLTTPAQGHALSTAEYSIEVAVCTWNRAGSLARLLDSFTKLEPPTHGAWRIIVVDNNSTDGTKDVVSRFAASLDILYLFEKTPGLSNARNRAWQHAGGELLVFTDDDVTVPATWLHAYEEAARAHPDASFFGGPVTPRFEPTCPGWIAKNPQVEGWLWASIDLGPSARLLRQDELVIGANMAYRRSKCAGLRFDVSLGRIGSVSLAGEETLMMRSIVSRGGYGVWVGAPGVTHHISSDRTTLKSIFKQGEGLGRTHRIRDLGIASHTTAHAVARLLAWALFSAVLFPVKNRLWLTAFVRLGFWRGFLSQSKQIRALKRAS